MRKVNFNTLNDLSVPPELIEKALAIPEAKTSVAYRSAGLRWRRPLIAAAIVLTAVSLFVIYGIFLAPASSVYLDSRESVTITLNSRGNVLSAGGYADLSGKPLQTAVDAIVGDMLDSGAVNADENTLLIGNNRLSEEAQANLLETVQESFADSRFHGATVSLSCTDNGAKAAIAEKLADAAELFSADGLKQLSANDLNILLHEYEVDDLRFSGKPSESGYIGKTAALKRAKANTDLSGATVTVTYSVYQGRLVYLVRIIKGDSAVAYFINADDGVIANALKTTPEQLEQEIRAEVKKNDAPDVRSPSAKNAVPDSPQIPAVDNGSTAADKANEPSATDASKEITAPAPLPTAAILPSTAPTVPPFTPTEKPSSEKPTAPPTEQVTAKPAESFRKDSLIADIPFSELIRYIDKTPDSAYGLRIPLTSITPAWQWRMNFQTVIPVMKKSDVMEIGKQDKHIGVFCTYEDYVKDTASQLVNIVNADEAIHAELTELNDYLQSMRNDNALNEDFFREYALVMLWYSEYTAYTNEVDSISSIEINGETAYITITREYRPEVTHHSEIDVYKSVTVAAVKKSDIKNIKDIKLIVITQSAE